MREEFLEAHRGAYPVHRLLCLSNCYINSRLYGCRYPSATMKEIATLSADLKATDMDKIMGVQKVKFVKGKEETNLTKINFVKSSDNSAVKQTTKDSKPVHVSTENGAFDSSKASTTKSSTPSSSVKSSFASQCEPKPVIHPPPKLKQNTPAVLAVNAKNEAIEATEQNSDNMTPIDQNLFDLAKSLDGLLKKDANNLAKDYLPIAAMKTKIVFTYKYRELPAPKGLHKFVCCIMYDSVELAEGEGGNKKKAKQSSLEEAGLKLSQKYLKVVRLNPETQVLKASEENFPSAWTIGEHIQPAPVSTATVHRESNASSLAACKKRKFLESSSDLSKFLLIEPMEATNSDNAKSVLQRSADFNKALLEYEFHDEGTGVRCRVILEGHILVDCFGTSRVTVKSAAAEKVMELLKDMCWTIKIKQAVDSDDAGLSRDEIFGEIHAQVNAIPEDNKGRQLLMKMGWTGGGVGAEGNKGREMPVAEELSKNQMISRAGLGSVNSSEKEFRTNVMDTLESYTKSGKQEDLVFAAEFTKDERAYIHQQAQKLGLKTQSRGSGEGRYLTVSRRRSAFQLFNHLVEEGGSTAKYELVAPAQNSQT